jgi:hypothetical protein
VVKSLSAVKNGQPGSPEPLDASKAYSSCPSDGATTEFTPLSVPTAIEACTP